MSISRSVRSHTRAPLCVISRPGHVAVAALFAPQTASKARGNRRFDGPTVALCLLCILFRGARDLRPEMLGTGSERGICFSKGRKLRIMALQFKVYHQKKVCCPVIVFTHLRIENRYKMCTQPRSSAITTKEWKSPLLRETERAVPSAGEIFFIFTQFHIELVSPSQKKCFYARTQSKIVWHYVRFSRATSTK